MITSIKREFNLFPNIVGIVTTDDLTVITTAGYFFGTQSAQVDLLNNGVWEWETEDLVLIFYSADQIGFFTYDATTDAFVSLAANGGLSNTLSAGDIFVGNASNVATGVAVSGILTMSDTGVTAIPATAGYALVGNSGGDAVPVAITGIVALTDAGVTSIPLASADLLVGSAGGVAAPVAMTGAVTITNAGVTSIANGAVGLPQLNATVQAVQVTTLTNAQLLALYTTPQLIVTAPASGQIAILDHYVIDYAFATAETAAGGLITAQYGNTDHAGGIICSTGIPAATLNGLSASGQLGDRGAPFGGVNTAVEATGIYLSNASGAFTTGAGTATVYAYYHLLTPA